MLAPLFGYFFCMITVLTTVVVLLTGFSNISTFGNGRHYPRPANARTVTVELQRHSPVVKEASPAKDVSPVVATAKADTKKSKHYKPKVFARQRDNYGYRNALGYAQEFRVRPKRSLFPLIQLTGHPFGSWSAFVIIEFPRHGFALCSYNSPEYQPLIAVRNRAQAIKTCCLCLKAHSDHPAIGRAR